MMARSPRNEEGVLRLEAMRKVTKMKGYDEHDYDDDQ